MRIENSELKRLGPGQVYLKQDAIGVNYLDTMVRDGRFLLPLPTVLGFEAAGTIEGLETDVPGFNLAGRGNSADFSADPG
jgi:NADPH:quinone reductase